MFRHYKRLCRQCDNSYHLSEKYKRKQIVYISLNRLVNRYASVQRDSIHTKRFGYGSD